MPVASAVIWVVDKFIGRPCPVWRPTPTPGPIWRSPTGHHRRWLAPTMWATIPAHLANTAQAAKTAQHVGCIFGLPRPGWESQKNIAAYPRVFSATRFGSLGAKEYAPEAMVSAAFCQFAVSAHAVLQGMAGVW